MFDEAQGLHQAADKNANRLSLARLFLERATLQREAPTLVGETTSSYVTRCLELLEGVEEGSVDAHMASSALLVLGQELLDAKDYKAAKKSLEEALLYEPHNVETISTLGHARVGDGYSYEIPPFHDRRDAADQAPTIKFVTFASDTTRCEFRRLVASAEHHGVELDVLGEGIETRAWKNGLKLELLRGEEWWWWWWGEAKRPDFLLLRLLTNAGVAFSSQISPRLSPRALFSSSWMVTTSLSAERRKSSGTGI